ncbi:aldehyde dehydrogenase family protein [Pseudomonas sp. S07E 245]|uniref:aldehyde dehydrogenase family protein n=1 Tax=unclassified Pseudomonas TaxID=196821 RepID=UPI000B50A6CD|nr:MULTISPECIES: aldehyde dehydrogenase family protein [unclassified Pseudomonas]QDC04136.1 aldehyde dehydrogenase family protein [Pseudomonas sp. SWI7]QYX54665.1 aldehyde dehydrogenase family protein [Pseudomonas sp. S07E 245]TFA88947.1 aldehyde dehydrogenase (NAD+) [Pseudomonas sp. URIL14HWK12:I1]SNB73790.1 aldehyde dehydrogenase (NAD+) [Pseudomonas sp. LAIL14HWK12:I4]
MQKYSTFFIGGQWVAPASSTFSRLAVIDPATEEAFAEIAMGTKEDVDLAVQAASKAFETFSQTTVEQRINLLDGVRRGLEERREDIAQIISREMGAPITFAREAQTFTCIAHVEAMIDILRSYKFEESLGTTQILKEPIGVVGLVTPWNWPLNQIICKVIPAIAAGCTVVLKPSEIAPLDAIIFAEILEHAGVPAGVFNLVNGDGPTVGDAISRHPDIQMVSFTGSTRAGIQVAKSAADTVKRVTQELGGKSANIILRGADLEQAVATGVTVCLSNSGQSCDAPTHMLVPAEHYEQALAIAAKVANEAIVGLPSDPATEYGPLASRMQFDKVQTLIESGVKEGARLVAGGLGRPDHLQVGFYAKPTIFADVTQEMAIVREEIFGPVLVISSYDTEKQAIEFANSGLYGLAAYVQSNDKAKANAVARQLRAGSVFVNYPDWDVMAPFGGYKQSGNGREGGPHALTEYLEVKAIVGYGA